MDLNIEENTLKHQNVDVPTEYNISEEKNKFFFLGMEYYPYTLLKLTTLESLI